jgi:formate hydrogenlyase transcriptional activator
VLERSVILTHGSTLHVAMPEFMETLLQVRRVVGIRRASQASEREQIIKALEEAKGQVGGPNGAAARLGLKRTTLQNRMQKYKIARQYH